MKGRWLQSLLQELRDRSVWRWSAGVLTAVALVLLLLRTEQPVTTTDREDLRGPDKPDGFIENATYRSFDTEGRLSLRMNSTRGEQFHDENRVTMESPRGTLFESESRAPWHIAARRGEYHLQKEQMELNSNVRVRHESARQGETLLKTQSLSLDNQERIVQTDAAVTILNESSVTRATGMKGWMDKRVVELENDVDGHYFNR